MARTTQTEITHTGLISAICEIQTRFVIAWNAAEMNGGIGQTHDLPAGATYSGSGPARGAAFLLPTSTRLYIHCRPPWWHWHDGWSFCRNTISPDQVLKVVVHGTESSFHKWFQAAMVEDMERQQRAYRQRRDGASCTPSPAWSQPQAQPNEQHHRDRVPLLPDRTVVLPQLRHPRPLASANASTRLAGAAQRLLPQLPRQADPADQWLQSSEPCSVSIGARLRSAACSAPAQAREVKASGRYTQRG